MLIVTVSALLAFALADDDVTRIAALVPVEAVTSNAGALAGRYSTVSEEVRRRVGPPLSGADLYLFPDRSYFWVEWTDILPPTVFDRGRWQADQANIHLVTGVGVTWKTTNEHEFVAIHRLTHPTEVRLIGTNRQLKVFERHATDRSADLEFFLLIDSLSREEAFDESKVAQLKLKLLAESWRPSFFRETP